MRLCFSCGIDNQGHTQAETDALKGFYMKRMGEIVSVIRERFSGKVYVGEGPQWNDERVADNEDGILFSFPNLLNDDEIENATADLIEKRATAYLEHAYYCLDNQPCWSRTSTDTTKHNMTFNLPAQSHDDYLGSDDECIQRTMQPYFSTQAIWYEGVLRAISKQSYFNT
jgi:hypothetical protein